MSGILLRAAGLAGLYLVVLASVAPGDVAVGAVLGLATAVLLRGSSVPDRAPPLPARIAAAAVLAARTAAETVRGSLRVARFCLVAESSPGFVEIPRGQRSQRNIALWAVLTTESPDAIVVDVDAERNVLVVHLVDARDPEGVREGHRRTNERWQRKVAP